MSTVEIGRFRNVIFGRFNFSYLGFGGYEKKEGFIFSVFWKKLKLNQLRPIRIGLFELCVVDTNNYS